MTRASGKAEAPAPQPRCSRLASACGRCDGAKRTHTRGGGGAVSSTGQIAPRQSILTNTQASSPPIAWCYHTYTRYGANSLPRDWTLWAFLLHLETARPSYDGAAVAFDAASLARHWRLLQTPPGKRRSYEYEVKTSDVYKLRKDLKGLVCGQTDKNLHELWFCCPCLYERAWEKMYNENTGYEKVYAKKITTNRRRMLWTACTTIGVKTRNTTWFKVRKMI